MAAPHTAGDPMRERQWRNGRLTDLEVTGDAQGQGVSRPVISRLLRAQDDHRQVNVTAVEGAEPPDRDTPFQ